MNIWHEIATVNNQNKSVALCTVVRTSGSTPRHAGAKMLVYPDGSISGTIGGGNLEKKVIENALEQIEKREPKLYKHDLLHQHSMCCGGTTEIYIEPIIPMKRLYIFGAGHTGQSLAQLAKNAGFEIFIIDDRHEYLNEITNKSINKLATSHTDALPYLPFTTDCFIVIATYEHSHDREILSYCIKKPHGYIGMIGSERKILLTRKMFLEGGIATEEELNRIDMPIGLPIHAENPYEIAVSILAKLISVKNEKK